MGYEVVYDAEKHCIVCRVSGRLDLPLLHAAASEVFPLMQKHQCFRLLNDLREASLGIPESAIRELPARSLEWGVPLTCRRALLVSRDHDSYVWYSSLCTLQDQEVMVFTDPGRARDWLGETGDGTGRPVP